MKVNQEFTPSFVVARRLICSGLMFIASTLCAAQKQPASSGTEIKFTAPREGTVLVNIYKSDGTLARRLVQGEHVAKGVQQRTWDGLLDDGTMAPPGDYTWKGLFHEGIGLKLRGWVGSGGGLPWLTPDGKGGWGGDRGVPSAVAADEKKVYLGWSLAENGKSVVACDLDGHVQWSHRRSEGPSGCKALAVDDGLVYVLGGLEGAGANGGAIYRLKTEDGTPVPWPNGAIDLKIFALWPPDGKTRPDMANAMAVRHGHIYLSFTNSQFLTLLDAKSGAYLQTVVGAPPGMIDVAPTQTPLPDSPDKLSDADFGVISLGDGVIGRILFAHDPFWVVTSDMTQLERDATFTALTVIGDHGKFHPRTAFIGYGAPYHQVQAYSLLNMDEPAWIAGRRGGRAPLGPWQADGLRAVRGVALAADGKLWVAENDGFPKRFSVWDTTGKQGKLVREFFGPPEKRAEGGAINPLDPDIMLAQNCEWRLSPKGDRVTCLGVISRDEMGASHFGVGKNGHAYLVASASPFGEAPLSIFERLGDGNYKLRSRIYYTDETGKEVPAPERDERVNTVFWSDSDGDGKEQPEEKRMVPYAIRFLSRWPGRDLTLPGAVYAPEPYGVLLDVKSWTPCGAPLYEPTVARKLPDDAFGASERGEYFLTHIGPNRLGGVGCVQAANGRTIWKCESPQDDQFVPFLGGSARLAAPLNNVWVLSANHGSWRLLTEDGFDFPDLLTGDDSKIRWPQIAQRGADMTHADAQGAWSGSLTKGNDGKLYLQTGRYAYWNLEFTGLEKVKALPGGKLTVPPAK